MNCGSDHFAANDPGPFTNCQEKAASDPTARCDAVNVAKFDWTQPTYPRSGVDDSHTMLCERNSRDPNLIASASCSSRLIWTSADASRTVPLCSSAWCVRNKAFFFSRGQVHSFPLARILRPWIAGDTSSSVVRGHNPTCTAPDPTATEPKERGI